MAKQFYVGGFFPSFKPIRTNGTKVLEVIDAAIAAASDAEATKYLNDLKERATADPAKKFYFTKEEAKLAGIIN